MATKTPIYIGVGLAIAVTTAVFAAVATGASAGPSVMRPATARHWLVVTQTLAPRRVVRTSESYGWPVKPFNRQHPVRGFLNDPRIGSGAHNFHWGVDVAAPDGTTVYAVEAGTVYFDNPQGIEVVAPGGTRRFAYWHINPAVRTGQYVRRHQLVGRIAKPWGHVHLAEHVSSGYVNPLRPGALEPYTDTTTPYVSSITVLSASSKRLVILAEAYDQPPLLVPGPFAGLAVTPALMEWRVVHVGERGGRWQTAIDSRLRMLDNGRYRSVYAAGTTQNHAREAGRYRFYLEHAWAPRDGRYLIQVRATDTAGNAVLAELRATIVAGRPAT